MSEEMKTGMLLAYQSVKEEVDTLTLPTVKTGGFLLQPLLHWLIPCGISMSYTVSTS